MIKNDKIDLMELVIKSMKAVEYDKIVACAKKGHELIEKEIEIIRNEWHLEIFSSEDLPEIYTVG